MINRILNIILSKTWLLRWQKNKFKLFYFVLLFFVLFLSIFFPQAPTSCKLKNKTENWSFLKETKEKLKKMNKKIVIIFLVFSLCFENKKNTNFCRFWKFKKGKFIKNQFHKWKLVENKEIRDVIYNLRLLAIAAASTLLTHTHPHIPPSPYL